MENLSLNRRATESRSFIVTLAVLNAKTDSFQTSSFLQPCDAGDYSRVKEPYLGVHSIEAKDADEMKTCIQCSVPGSDKMKLIIFHAGLLPNTGTLSSALNSKLSFFAKSKGYNMTYYTTSTSYSARLALLLSPSSSEVPKLTCQSQPPPSQLLCPGLLEVGAQPLH
jgi:hypothetical protein